MGCSSSEANPNNLYTILYCSLIPVKGKKNIYQIHLIAQEEAPKISERKFFDQVAQNQEKDILEFVKNENFNKHTIFYLYHKNMPQIKNLYQMINLIPCNYNDLHRIILLSTEHVEGFYNYLIEKKTLHIDFHKFVGSTLDLNDMVSTVENVNNINLTNDNINYDENEGNNDDEIYINGIIDEKKVEHIKQNYSQKIIKISISEVNIKNKNSFVELMQFLSDKDIKKFAFYDSNIVDDILFNSVMDLLEKNYHIRNLILHDCNLIDKHLIDLMRAISDKRIRYLNLSKNAITVEGASFVSEFLLVNKTLLELNMSNNDHLNFKAEGIKYIARSLVHCPNILLVDFSEMNLTGCGEFMANFIEASKTLEVILLKNNHLNAHDFKNIFEKIKTNKNIKEIDISYNDMGGDKSLEYIRDSIKMNESLITLRMDKININNDNYNIIFEGIKENKNIDYYSMSYNKVNPKIILEFFIKQKQVKNLEYIPYDKNVPEDKNKDFTLEEKKLLEKYKNERPDLNIINII